MLERRIGDNYHQAIDAYKTAIRITQDADKIAQENGEQFATAPFCLTRISGSDALIKR